MADLSSYYGLTLGTDVSVEQIKNATAAAEVRVAYPESPLTMDYIETRLTILIDHDRVIKQMIWG